MYDSIIISDLHLGSEICQAKTIDKFLSAIKHKEILTKELILNGDVFDSWDFRRLKKTHWNVLSMLRKLSDEIHIIWINGNHDGPAEIVSHLLGVDVAEEYIFQSGDKKILALHGDKFDSFITKHPIITAIADFFYRKMQYIDKSFYWSRWAKKTSKTFLRCSQRIEAKAIEYCKKKGCDIVCCGHTHMAIEHKENGYFNSGCWTELPPTYLTILDGAVNLRWYYEDNNSDGCVAPAN
jgi:UDP-2,3-diacylglucosamine pyrophosphatase LpxH